jgi:UDP-N-acetylglucosamine--N-acetylmuramyl-(pentapeptide) pyrophosphoryl-undecaprenol N-acetylglucosamine transferase
MDKKKIIITGGGTGGHVYPALAIAQALRSEYDIVYIGHPHRLEAQVVPQYKYPFYGILTFPRPKKVGQIPEYVFSFLSSLREARRLIRKIKPDLVIGMGGFISFPVVLMAWVQRLPVILHEQNVIPGKANRIFVKLGIPLMASFEGTASYISAKFFNFTGCPVREKIGKITKKAARQKLGIAQDLKVCLLFGGSGGAAQLNKIALNLKGFLKKESGYLLIHIAGPHYYKELKDQLNEEKNANYKLLEYVDDIENYYAASDLVISRSGAVTIAELMAAKKPAILIPSPNVKDNHQELNARYLEAKGLAKVFLETELETKSFEEVLKLFWQESNQIEDKYNEDKETQQQVILNIKIAIQERIKRGVG